MKTQYMNIGSKCSGSKMIGYLSSVLPVIFSLVLLGSCKNETTEKLKQAKDNANAAVNIMKDAGTIQERAQELSKKDPLSNEQFKGWLPESLSGMERTSYRVGSSSFSKASSIRGKYNSDGKEFKIEVIDGAGPMASMVLMAGTSYQMDMEEEDEYKHVKKVTRNGIEARQTYLKKQNHTHLNFLYENRFYVEVRSKGMNVDETWETLKDISLDDLL